MFSTPLERSLSHGRVRFAGDDPPFHPTQLPGSLFYVDPLLVGHTIGNNASGNNVAITGAGPNWTLAGPGINASMTGGTITLAGYTNPANNGSFTLVTTAANTCTFNNPAGAAEAAGASKTWVVTGMFTQCVGLTGVGGASQIACTQVNNTNQFSCNTTFLPGKRLFATGTAGLNARFYTGLSSVFSALDGVTPCTCYIYLYPLNFSGATTLPVQITNNGNNLATWSGHRGFQYVTAINAKSVNRTILGGAATTYNVTFTMTANQWQGVSFAYDGNQTAEAFLNGVSQGTFVSATTRSLSGLDRIIFGSGNNTIVTPGNGSQMYLGGVYVNSNFLGASTQQRLTQFFQRRIAA